MADAIVLVTQGKQQYVKVLTETAYRRGYSPYINEDGFWMVYDDAAKEFVQTDVQSRGQKGDQGDKGENGADYILSEDDKDEIAVLVDQHTYNVSKVTLQLELAADNGELQINFGTTADPDAGSVEVATDVEVVTPEGA